MIIDSDERLARIDDHLYKLAKPQSYVGKSGLWSRYTKDFEEMAFILSQKSSRNPKSMTVMEYYQAWEVLRDQAKAERAANRSTK